MNAFAQTVAASQKRGAAEAETQRTSERRGGTDDCVLVEWSVQLSMCSRRLRQRIAECARRIGLNDAEFLILWLSNQHMPAGAAQSDLVTATGVSPAQMSGLVEKLRRRQLLESRRCNLDRRRQLWLPTTTGQQLLNSVSKEFAALSRQVDHRLSADERGVFRKVIDQLNAVCQEHFSPRLFEPNDPAQGSSVIAKGGES